MKLDLKKPRLIVPPKEGRVCSACGLYFENPYSDEAEKHITTPPITVPIGLVFSSTSRETDWHYKKPRPFFVVEKPTSVNPINHDVYYNIFNLSYSGGCEDEPGDGRKDNLPIFRMPQVQWGSTILNSLQTETLAMQHSLLTREEFEKFVKENPSLIEILKEEGINIIRGRNLARRLDIRGLG